MDKISFARKYTIQFVDMWGLSKQRNLMYLLCPIAGIWEALPSSSETLRPLSVDIDFKNNLRQFAKN